MIRFVDMRHVNIAGRFAWWTTFTDQFERFADREAWDTWDQFVEDCWLEGPELERFKRLVPAWAFLPPDTLTPNGPVYCPSCGRAVEGG